MSLASNTCVLGTWPTLQAMMMPYTLEEGAQNSGSGAGVHLGLLYG